ncbi:hypothetical protein D3C80_1930900 [compost metagenome]
MVNSVKPMIEVTAVPLTTCTEKPTVGATAMRNACGRITWRSCSMRLSARLPDASHWPFGMDSTQPRQISARNALVNRVRAMAAAIQADTSRPNKAMPKNTMNSCISNGVP